MELYNVLEADYKKSATEAWDVIFDEEAKNADTLKAFLKSDPCLQLLEDEEKASFLKFASCCNTVAARSLGEISIAIHPESKESSVVIVAERIQTMGAIKSYLETAVNLSFQVAMEPLENGKGIVLYFTHVFVS